MIKLTDKETKQSLYVRPEMIAALIPVYLRGEKYTIVRIFSDDKNNTTPLSSVMETPDEIMAKIHNKT